MRYLYPDCSSGYRLGYMLKCPRNFYICL